MPNQFASILVCLLILEIASAAPPTRKFDATGAPTFIRLDGKTAVNPATDVDGNFLIGPEYTPAPEGKIIEGVPQGKNPTIHDELKGRKTFQSWYCARSLWKSGS